MMLAAISRVQEWRADTGNSVMLAAGALLLCGLFAGKVAKGVGLPRLTGYLLVGVAMGPYALGFIPGEGVKGLELVKGLAVSLIALAAGTELQLGLIRRVGAQGGPAVRGGVRGDLRGVFGGAVRAQAAAALPRVHDGAAGLGHQRPGVHGGGVLLAHGDDRHRPGDARRAAPSPSS